MATLPFLRKKHSGAAGLSIEYRKPDPEGEGHNDREDNDDEGLHACAQDIIECVSSGDKVGLAKALKAAFEICDAEPHEEGEHTNEPQEEESE